MTQPDSTEALRKGIRAARRKDHAAARTWLRRVVEADPAREEAWLWLARVTEDAAEKRQALEQALALNPDNRWAAQQLDALGGTEAPPPPAGDAAQGPAQPRLETLQCPSCGGTVEIRNQEGAKTVVCQYCGSVLDLTPAQAEIIGRTDLKLPALQPIELGMKGTFDGITYEVTGWMRYRGSEDGEIWIWDEWLLLGEDGSARWLSYDPEEGFLLQRRVPIDAPFDPETATRIRIPGKHWATVTERSEAELIALRGELTWRATVGDRIRYLEAAAGKTRYSVEYSREELELSAGKSWSDRAIWAAFGQTERAAEAGEQANRSQVIGQLFLACFALAAVSMLLFLGAGCSGTEKLQATATLKTQGETAALGTAELSRDGLVHRVTIRCQEPPMNTWSLASVWAYDEKDTKYLLGTLNCWAENGTDDEGYWEERQIKQSHVFKPATSGTYRFEVMLEESSYEPVAVDVLVEDGVWHRTPFGFAIVAFLGIAFLLFRTRNR